MNSCQYNVAVDYCGVRYIEIIIIIAINFDIGIVSNFNIALADFNTD